MRTEVEPLKIQVQVIHGTSGAVFGDVAVEAALLDPVPEARLVPNSGGITVRCGVAGTGPKSNVQCPKSVCRGECP